LPLVAVGLAVDELRATIAHNDGESGSQIGENVEILADLGMQSRVDAGIMVPGGWQSYT
jgi:hypothetical protein